MGTAFSWFKFLSYELNCVDLELSEFCWQTASWEMTLCDVGFLFHFITNLILISSCQILRLCCP